MVFEGERAGLYVHVAKQICREYRDKFLEKIARKALFKPYMKYREMEVIEDILRGLKPQKCLEWGAGLSTLYFPRFLEGSSKWIAVEHDREWFEKVRDLNENRNVEIFYVPSDSAYVEYPTRFKPFDFILIDGRARKDCLIKAHDLVADSGVVVLHDANRKCYHQPFHLYEHQVLFKDYRSDSGGLWIGSRGLNIEQILDVEKHRFYWEKVARLGNILKRFLRTERIGM